MSYGGTMTVEDITAVLNAHVLTSGVCSCKKWEADPDGPLNQHHVRRQHALHQARMVIAIPHGRVYAKPRGLCPQPGCGKDCAIRQDGTLQTHRVDGSICRGSNQPPRQEATP